MWQWLDCGVLLARVKKRLDMFYLYQESLVNTYVTQFCDTLIFRTQHLC